MSDLKLKVVDGVYHVHGTFMGQRVRKSLKVPKGPGMKALAEAEVRDIKKEIMEGVSRGPVAHGKTMVDVWYGYMEWRKSQGRLQHQQEREMMNQMDWWGTTAVAKVTTSKIMEWVKEQRVKPGTTKRRLNDLSAALNLAKSMGWIRDVPEIPRPKVDDARDRYLNIEQIDQLWADFEKEKVGVNLGLLVDAGPRLSEAVAVRWADVDLKAGEVTIRRKVNGKPRTRSIKLSDRLWVALEWAKEQGWKVPFGNAAGEPFKDRWEVQDYVTKALDGWLEKYGIDDFRLHDLRHTFAFQAGHHGVDLGDLMVLMGHTNISMTMRYRGFIKSRAQVVIGGFGKSGQEIGRKLTSEVVAEGRNSTSERGELVENDDESMI
jgi:integrase